MTYFVIRKSIKRKELIDLKKRSISITAVIVAAVICIGIVLATGVMDKASLSGSTAGLLTNKAILFENINPSMSKEEVEAAGLPLNTEPEYEVEASDGVLASITYAVDTRKVSITLDDVTIPSALVQFTEGKLSGITLNTPGAEGVQKIRERLITELGDVQKTQTMDNGRGSSTVDSWEIREEDLLTRIGMVFRYDENGKAIAANLQINWLPKDLYPILFEEASE